MAVWQEYRTIEDAEAKIWRFMDFEKFVDLISSGSLHFARADKLGDPFEGSFLPAQLLRSDGDNRILTEEQKEAARPGMLSNRERMAVSCWHRNEHESAAMWHLYMPQGRGIAVRSTVARLRAAVPPGGPCIGAIGWVNYINYTSDSFYPEAKLSIFDGIFHKRKSYEHERELRAVAIFPRPGDETEAIEPGVLFRADLAVLIEEVYACPKSPEWVRQLAERVLAKYGLDVKVQRSALDATPLY